MCAAPHAEFYRHIDAANVDLDDIDASDEAEQTSQRLLRKAALQARELALDQQLSLAMGDYRTARERVTKYASKILPAARETHDMISTGYQQGQLDYVQVLTVQQTFAAKNLSYLQDLETAWKEWAGTKQPYKPSKNPKATLKTCSVWPTWKRQWPCWP